MLVGSLEILVGIAFLDNSTLIVTVLKKWKKWKTFITPKPSSLYDDVVIKQDVFANWKDTCVSQLMGCNTVADVIANVSNWFCSKATEG